MDMMIGPGMDMPIMHDSDRYDFVRDIGAGNFGIARLMRDKVTKKLVAVKYIVRGEMIDENVQREIINHMSLVRFKEVILMSTHLAIVMEYASGGELFSRISNASRFSEDERITIPEIKNLNWFQKNLPADLMDENMICNQFDEAVADQPMQSLDKIMQIISEATILAVGVHGFNQFVTDSLDMDDDLDTDSDLDVDSSGEIVYADAILL